MSNSVEEEDVLQDLMARRHWTRLSKAPTGVLPNCAVVAWDEKRAIITGGRVLGDVRTVISATSSVYNKDTLETEALPSMQQARWGHAAVIVGGNLFVIGGHGRGGHANGIILNSIEVLDLNDPREWKLFPAALRVARRSCSVVAANEREIYIIGGFGRGHQILDSVEILNISTKTVSQGRSMLEPRSSFAASLIGDSIVVAGGGGARSRFLSSCEQLSMHAGSNEEARRWQPLDSMAREKISPKGLSFGNFMVVVGGFNRLAASRRMTEVWRDTTGTWTQLPARLPVGVSIRGCVTLGNDLVCFVGGDDPSVYCLFSAKGLLEHQRRQIRFNELIADERVEIVIPLLLEGLGQRGWTSLFYECIRETNGRLIPRRRRSALGKRSHAGRLK